jgi:hypothetical protein
MQIRDGSYLALFAKEFSNHEEHEAHVGLFNFSNFVLFANFVVIFLSCGGAAWFM